MNAINLINRIKYSKKLYKCYLYAGSALVFVLKKVLKTDDRLILYTSYSGKRYDDTPRNMYEAMIKDHRFDGYRIVWAFMNPDRFSIPNCEKIEINSFKYLKTALKARVWITNVNMTRGLGFKGIHTLSFNSWHGTAVKFIGGDIKSNNETFVLKNESDLADIMIAQGEYDQKIYSRAFNLPLEKVYITGFPRNDSLVTNNNPDYINKIKEKLNLDPKKQVILYAPTYRDFEKDEGNNCVLKPPFDISKWKRLLSEDYILLIRAHQEVVNVLDVNEDEFVRNLSLYPELNDILLITDILISDYSGILFDYSIIGRKIFCYTYDYDRYEQERGMYIDVRKDLPSYDNEDDLLSAIQNGDDQSDHDAVIRFRIKYVEKYGDSAQRAIDVIYEELNKQ